MKLFAAAALFLVSFAINANECQEITKCIEYVSKLTNKKYLFNANEIRGGLQATTNTEIKAENADTLFTYILDLNGYARIPTEVKDTYMIVRSSDIRYQAVPTIHVSSENPPKLVPNHDYYMMTYKFKHFKDGQPRIAANSLRPFMSRYARVIEIGDSVTVQENAAKLAAAFEHIKRADRELTKEEIAAMKAEREERKEFRKKEEKKDSKKTDKNESKE